MENPFSQLASRFDKVELLLEKILADMPDIKLFNSGSEKFMNIKEASEFLNLQVPTLYSKVSNGEIPYNKRAGRLYFSKAELILWIKEGKRETIAEQVSSAIDNLSKRKKR
ncbi:MAG: helix-turn-helix domain-containing protein [Bacteroidia bacterium]|nr:helix-turn-helix domain-containing protein [Bacteroidota bacterium]MBK8872983.1 helix-turn-helix domain-containing protein [Bacteroidota bacterium]MBP9081918.1 helix-turn-helix domain-containing protein [Bacteroidia bacterium]